MRTQEVNRLGDTHASVNESIQKVTAFLDKEIEMISKALRKHINKHDGLRKTRDFMKSIPAVGDVTIEAILSEANGFEGFDTIEQVVAFMGLSPKEHTSGTSVKARQLFVKSAAQDYEKSSTCQVFLQHSTIHL